MEAIVNGMKLNLCNIYAPNVEYAHFFHKANKLLGDIVDGHTVIGGDFNQIQDNVLDRTTYSKTVPKGTTFNLGLVDIWRLANPREKEYTFYSHKHKSHSRLDYFLTSKSMVESIMGCRIGIIALTDHATVELCLVTEMDSLKRNRWRLNTSLYQDPAFDVVLSQDLKSFFEINVGSTENLGTVWEASKAFIRGKIIAYSCKKKRESIEKLKKVESQLKEKEGRLANSYSDSLLKQVCALKFGQTT